MDVISRTSGSSAKNFEESEQCFLEENLKWQASLLFVPESLRKKHKIMQTYMSLDHKIRNNSAPFS